MKRISSVAFSALLLAIPMSASSVAQERHDERRDERRDDRRDGRRDDRHDELRQRFDERGWGWRGEIHDFRGHDFDVWRGGRWYQGPYDGRDGWWWVVGDAWYPYAAPIYPYPDPYVPPVVPAAPASVPEADAPPTPQFWYYCADPPGYYPYVQICSTNWQQVEPRQ